MGPAGSSCTVPFLDGNDKDVKLRRWIKSNGMDRVEPTRLSGWENVEAKGKRGAVFSLGDQKAGEGTYRNPGVVDGRQRSTTCNLAATQGGSEECGLYSDVDEGNFFFLLFAFILN